MKSIENFDDSEIRDGLFLLREAIEEAKHVGAPRRGRGSATQLGSVGRRVPLLTHARIDRTTLPATSVRRKSRPLKR